MKIKIFVQECSSQNYLKECKIKKKNFKGLLNKGGYISYVAKCRPQNTIYTAYVQRDFPGG